MSNSINSTTSTNASNNLIPVALDPARSVVVEACAGSGKTWLLASRIVRLLLAGVAPGNILAITFTRKAAREIEARVVDWLRLLATDSDSNVTQFLAERGIEIGGETRSQIDRSAGRSGARHTAQGSLALRAGSWGATSVGGQYLPWLVSATGGGGTAIGEFIRGNTGQFRLALVRRMVAILRR